MTEDRVIGRDGDLPWHLPADLKFFKKTTLNSAILMGRKTYESIGKPLPKRRNIVLTRDENWSAEGVEVIHSVEGVNDLPNLSDENLFVIGGAEVYELFLPSMDELIITHVLEPYKGDTYFPEYQKYFRKNVQIMKEDNFLVVKYF